MSTPVDKETVRLILAVCLGLIGFAVAIIVAAWPAPADRRRMLDHIRQRRQGKR